MPAVTIHPLEAWRRKKGMNQFELGAAIYATRSVIWKAEHGQPIREKYVDRLIEFSGGKLKKADFILPSPRKKKEVHTHGKTKNRKKPGKGKRAKTRERQRGAEVPR